MPQCFLIAARSAYFLPSSSLTHASTIRAVSQYGRYGFHRAFRGADRFEDGRPTFLGDHVDVIQHGRTLHVYVVSSIRSL